MASVVCNDKQSPGNRGRRPGTLFLVLIVGMVCFKVGYRAGKIDSCVAGAETATVQIKQQASADDDNDRPHSATQKYQENQSSGQEPHDWRQQVKFMVVGVMKGGTTSMHAYTMQHPRMIQNRRKELRCFTSRRNASDPFCENDYNVTGLKLHPDSITGDYSPGYLFNFVNALPRIERSFPWIKVIAILRNPVDRLLSQHNMDIKHKSKKLVEGHGLADRVLEDLENLRLHGVVPFFRFHSGNNESMTLQDWHSATVDQELFRAFRDSMEESKAWKSYFFTTEINHAIVSQGFYSMQLHHWMKVFPPDRFLILKTESLAEPEGLDQAIQRFHEHVGLPYVPLEYTNRSNIGTYHVPQMDDMVNQTLQKVFAPYIAELESLLGPEWKDPW